MNVRAALSTMLIACSLPVALLAQDGGVVVQPKEAPAEFVIETTDALRGEEVLVRVGIRAKARLSGFTMAINFDEEDMKIVDAKPLFNAFNDAEAEASVVAEFNNDNASLGNQAHEGWIYISAKSRQNLATVNSSLGELIPVFALQIVVRADAKDGRSPLRFEDIGPLRTVDHEIFLKNTVTLATEDVVDPPAEPVDGEELEDGALNIVGEVGFFMRADTTFDFERNLRDPVMTLRHLFTPDLPELPCQDSADANDDGRVDIGDPVYTLVRLFLSRDPFPDPHDYGPDPTNDDLDCVAAGDYGDGSSSGDSDSQESGG